MTVRSVLVAHRQRMVADGLAAALSRCGQIASVAVATSGRQILERGMVCDAVAMDDDFPLVEELTRRLRQGGVRVVRYGAAAARGAEDDLRVSTSAPIQRLVQALVPGIQAITPRVPILLTRREQEVLRLVATGLAAKQVGSQLGVTVKTIEHHKARIYRKLGVPNQAAAVKVAVAEGLV